jgi:hypothetical protein
MTTVEQSRTVDMRGGEFAHLSESWITEYKSPPKDWQKQLLDLIPHIPKVIVLKEENSFASKGYKSGDVDYFFLYGDQLREIAPQEFRWLRQLYEELAEEHNAKADDPILLGDDKNGININVLVGPDIASGNTGSTYDTHNDRNKWAKVLSVTDQNGNDGAIGLFNPGDPHPVPDLIIPQRAGRILTFNGHDTPHTILPVLTPHAIRMTAVFSYGTVNYPYNPDGVQRVPNARNWMESLD